MPDSETGPLEFPPDRVEVDLGGYNPTEEAVVNNWKQLEHIAPEKGRDLKLEFIESLGKTDQEIMAAARAAKEAAEISGDKADLKRIADIFVLRKMMLGHDWRTEQVAGQAREYIIEKKRLLLRQVQALNRQPKTQKISAAIATLHQRFQDLTGQQENLDQVIAQGYPQLWETITKARQEARKPEAGETSENPTEEMAPGSSSLQREMEEIQAEEREAEQELEAEKERITRLSEAIEKKLPPRYRECAPEIAAVLIGNGLNFVERDDFVTRDGKTQEVVKFIIFADPLSAKARENFPSADNQNFEHGASRFAADFKKIASSPEIPARIKIALNQFFNRRWDYAEEPDAKAILESLRQQDQKPHAMYIKKGLYTNSNLMAVRAESGLIDLHVQPTNQAPEYTDGTVFSSAPVFTFDIKKENVETK